MADKFLNETGVATIRDWANGKFALDSDLDAIDGRTTDLEEAVQELIVEGGEPNVIEVVKKNGTALTPDANKAVDMTVPEVAKSGSGESEKVTITEGQNSFDVPTVDAMEDYVSEHGGVIQKVKRNGTELPIDSTDKSVNIDVPDSVATTSANGLMSSTDKAKLDAVEAEAQKNVQSDWNQTTTTADDFIKNKPTKLSDFTNDGDGTSGSTFPTTADMEEAIESAVVGALKPKGSVTFANLPALSATNLNNMYNVSESFTTTADFVEGAGIAYPAGTNVAIINVGTDANPTYKYDAMVGTMDLSAYWTSATGANNSLNAMTVAEINAILTPSNP